MSESKPGAIIPFDSIAAWRADAAKAGRTVVATNGCFDLLHVGHLRYLETARALGDVLWVGVNDDAGVVELKGPTRPLNPAEDRAELLAALHCVDAVTIFPGKRAVEFLRRVGPDVYAKGGDYTIETLDADERDVLQAANARIEILQLIPGRSTTTTIAKMKK